jgi:hypothetical protein
MAANRTRRLAALAAAAMIVILSLAGAASGRTVYIVRNGFYAGMDDGSGALTFFHIKNHRVYHLRMSLNLDCQNSNTGQDYQVNYNAGPKMPQGQAVGSNGRANIDWTETEAGRDGHISAEISFSGRRPLASFSVISNGGYETCNGFSAIYIARSPANVPIPRQP